MPGKRRKKLKPIFGYNDRFKSVSGLEFNTTAINLTDVEPIYELERDPPSYTWTTRTGKIVTENVPRFKVKESRLLKEFENLKK